MAPSPAVVNEAAVDPPSDVVQKNPKKKWVSYIWDTFDKSPEERRLIFKLDTAILTFASLGMYTFMQSLYTADADWLGYFIKYFDQVNINNAFISGM